MYIYVHEAESFYCNYCSVPAAADIVARCVQCRAAAAAASAIYIYGCSHPFNILRRDIYLHKNRAPEKKKHRITVSRKLNE